MPPLIERRKPIGQTPVVLAVMFGLGALVALVYGAVPTWQNHGPDAGPSLVRRSEEPGLYYGLTATYCLVTSVSVLLTFFRFPRVTVRHVWLALIFLFLLMLLTPMVILMLRT